MEVPPLSTGLIQVLSDTDIDWCARRLLGAKIIRRLGDRELGAVIVETESYDQSDPVSHSYTRTPRSEVMYGPAGRAYVYFIYGMYYCFNVVSGPAGFGAGVLVRAAQPDAGFGSEPPRLNGPGKLCRALAIDKNLSGHDLRFPPLMIELESPLAEPEIVRAERIGLSRSLRARKRFYIKGNPHVSRL